jgi:hypothetical protein
LCGRWVWYALASWSLLRVGPPSSQFPDAALIALLFAGAAARRVVTGGACNGPVRPVEMLMAALGLGSCGDLAGRGGCFEHAVPLGGMACISTKSAVGREKAPIRLRAGCCLRTPAIYGPVGASFNEHPSSARAAYEASNCCCPFALDIFRVS